VENYRTTMPTAKSCKKCIVAGENLREIRAEIRYHIPANLPTCFYKYACIVPCTQLVLILRGINILSISVRYCGTFPIVLPVRRIGNEPHHSDKKRISNKEESREEDS
jgi:hypothetical protein